MPDPSLVAADLYRLLSKTLEESQHLTLDGFAADCADAILAAYLVTPRCGDLTNSPRGLLRCVLRAGHEVDPLSMHLVVLGGDSDV